MKPMSMFAKIALIYCGLLGAWVQVFSDSKEEPPREFKTVRAAKAKEEYNVATTRALLECDDRLRAARKKYSDALNISVKQATKAGDLKEAQLLQSTIDAMVNTETALPLGNWIAMYSHSHGTFEIRFEGNDQVNADKKAGRVRKVEQHWMLDLDQDNLMRLTADGDRFFVEQWEKKEDFNLGKPSAFIAIAHRQEKKS